MHFIQIYTQTMCPRVLVLTTGLSPSVSARVSWGLASSPPQPSTRRTEHTLTDPYIYTRD